MFTASVRETTPCRSQGDRPGFPGQTSLTTHARRNTNRFRVRRSLLHSARRAHARMHAACHHPRRNSRHHFRRVLALSRAQGRHHRQRVHSRCRHLARVVSCVVENRADATPPSWKTTSSRPPVPRANPSPSASASTMPAIMILGFRPGDHARDARRVAWRIARHPDDDSVAARADRPAARRN